ncbi:MAG: UDP-2,4-diacetamido-2,4,6-trideoxy-beta-L-altropyranose hydrolase, partial [Candidatus Sulfotelmatobacter sp.]
VKCVDLGTLLVRADGGVAMGTGHVMRCLALAQAWQDSGGNSIFAMAEDTPSLQGRLRDEGIEAEHLEVRAGTAEDAEQTRRLAVRTNADWIVVDGYQFGSAYQSLIKGAGFKLLFMDDYVHAEPYTADLVLNQNLQADPSLYAKRAPSTQLLLGPRYAMLRREFCLRRNWRREIPAIGRKILVTMGGSDPDNLTAKVIEAIQNLSDPALEATILVGGSNPHLRLVEELIRGQKLPIRLVIDACNVSEWMMWADVAVAGAGTTFWEMCFLGLPGLLLVLASNQEKIAETAERMGIAWILDKQSQVSASTIAEKLKKLLHSENARKQQSANGRKLVDGRGAGRVVAFLSGLNLRRTTDSDCETFWDWANDPEARAASFRSKAISWEEHARWFRAKMVDLKAILYTATNKHGDRVGEVRYQIEGKRAQLSISVDKRYRGRGVGQKLLTLATEKVFQDSAIECIDAYVKPANAASVKLFTSVGFLRLSSESIEGQEAIHFVLERSGVA